ncbi:unnamed protein product [Rangifer tarandus platyrhynchus]|uniref:Uncharacterized protein n=1 Tax=Rangifer tarandus platyrhynchus TaxID=3082113 RepID=A0ACB1MJN2_RANTA
MWTPEGLSPGATAPGAQESLCRLGDGAEELRFSDFGAGRARQLRGCGAELGRPPARGVSAQEKLLVGEGLARQLSEYLYFLNLSTLTARNTAKRL